MRSQSEESERERKRGRGRGREEGEEEEEEEKRQKREEDIHIHPPVASQPATYTRLPPITCGRDRKRERGERAPTLPATADQDNARQGQVRPEQKEKKKHPALP